MPSRKRHICLSATLLSMLAVLAGRPTARTAELSVVGRANANPSVAAMGRFVAVVWGAAAPEGATDLYAAVSRDGGQTFGSPLLVNDAASTASLAAEQPPRVALIPRAGSQPAIVVVWTSKAPAGTRLLTARSDDGGRSFSSATAMPGSEAAGNRGL
jgi:hypothetical protein